MKLFSSSSFIGVLGAGTMGSGIAQVAATAGHQTVLFDANRVVLEKASDEIKKNVNRLVEKGKLTATDAQEILKRITYATSLFEFRVCRIVIEAIIEDLAVKQQTFSELEKIVGPEVVLATNTSSLSVTSIAASCHKPQRVLGVHFFNPAPLMPLVEIIAGLTTAKNIAEEVRELIESMGKVAVNAKDTPGFIVNRVARPFYGESIRIHEERWNGLAEGALGYTTIDWALKEIGGFRMGPFELMDMIGNDINYTVTETVWKQFYHEPRYKPSLTQKRLLEAGRLGKKTGHGYYDYTPGSAMPEPVRDKKLGQAIVERVVAMLINEAADAVYMNVATPKDVDLAMTKGVNYPKGLLKWCDELGAKSVVATLNKLQSEYGEERYRTSVLLRKMAEEGNKFYS